MLNFSFIYQLDYRGLASFVSNTKVTWRLLLLLLSWLGSQNHGMTLVGRDFRVHLIPSCCSQQGHLPLDQDVLTMGKKGVSWWNFGNWQHPMVAPSGAIWFFFASSCSMTWIVRPWPGFFQLKGVNQREMPLKWSFREHLSSISSSCSWEHC